MRTIFCVSLSCMTWRPHRSYILSGMTWRPRRSYIRITVGCFYFFFIIILVIYAGNLTALFTVSKIRLRFNTLDELVATDLSWGSLSMGSIYQLFKVIRLINILMLKRSCLQYFLEILKHRHQNS